MDGPGARALSLRVAVEAQGLERGRLEPALPEGAAGRGTFPGRFGAARILPLQRIRSGTTRDPVPVPESLSPRGAACGRPTCARFRAALVGCAAPGGGARLEGVRRSIVEAR